jgi:hypothetical protein
MSARPLGLERGLEMAEFEFDYISLQAFAVPKCRCCLRLSLEDQL